KLPHCWLLKSLKCLSLQRLTTKNEYSLQIHILRNDSRLIVRFANYNHRHVYSSYTIRLFDLKLIFSFHASLVNRCANPLNKIKKKYRSLLIKQIDLCHKFSPRKSLEIIGEKFPARYEKHHFNFSLKVYRSMPNIFAACVLLLFVCSNTF